MKNFVMASALSLISFAAFAQDDVYTRYETLAKDIATQVVSASPNLQALSEKNAELIQLGVQIMHLYGQKFPECNAQYVAFEQALPTIQQLSLGEIEARYHDGEGLPAAPRHCYYGRALVVHPEMNAVRINDGLSGNEAAEVEDESMEVAHHVRTAQKRIEQ